MNNIFLYVEKYRPTTINECILPENLKKIFNDIVENKEIPNMILAGGPGCGKTTVAKALCNELNIDYMFINASEYGNIDTLRTTIRNFASTVSLTGGYKVVILDEGDYLNPQSTQPALRGFMEEFSKNCRFIITCNFKNKIIDPLHSRCSVIDFKIPAKETQNLALEMLTRLEKILNQENVKYNKKVLAEFILNHFPDYRRILGEIQTYSASGEIDEGILKKYSDISIDELITSMKNKNFTEVRKWVAQNKDIDHSILFRKIYDNLSVYLDKSCIPKIILILAEYQYKMAFSADSEITLAACMVEIMLEAKFN